MVPKVEPAFPRVINIGDAVQVKEQAFDADAAFSGARGIVMGFTSPQGYARVRLSEGDRARFQSKMVSPHSILIHPESLEEK
jgi:hypothetical protein|tara:strand:- start:34 stop:279 length:246 start_codon:yes stop_codon:yes gene_type:complete